MHTILPLYGAVDVSVTSLDLGNALATPWQQVGTDTWTGSDDQLPADKERSVILFKLQKCFVDS